jgi:hypothetical protein
MKKTSPIGVPALESILRRFYKPVFLRGLADLEVAEVPFDSGVIIQASAWARRPREKYPRWHFARKKLVFRSTQPRLIVRELERAMKRLERDLQRNIEEERRQPCFADGTLP